MRVSAAASIVSAPGVESHRLRVLEELARRYEAGTTGLTGAEVACRWVGMDELLRRAGCDTGDSYELALGDLQRAAAAGALEVDVRRGEWRRVRVTRGCEEAFYRLLGRASPTERRKEWAAMFREAGEWEVPAAYAVAWRRFCTERAERVLRGEGFEPFSRRKRKQARVQLQLAVRLLAWERRTLLRTVSAQLCRDSKQLGLWRGTLERLLELGSGGAVSGFAALGIEDNPSAVRVHGPLRMARGGAAVDYGGHLGEYAIAVSDLECAVVLETTARRCVTVENPTTFHELCRLGCGDLFVCTSYPNEATVRFLRSLPERVELFHFGDSDVWGFDVLGTLRRRTGRKISPLHMVYRPMEGSAVLNSRERRKVAELVRDEVLEDVRGELMQMAEAGAKGDFEQERLMVTAEFPYAREISTDRRR